MKNRKREKPGKARWASLDRLDPSPSGRKPKKRISKLNFGTRERYDWRKDADEATLREANAEILKSSRKAGLLGPTAPLPAGLDQFVVAEERETLRKAIRKPFKKRFRRGWRAFFVTVINPAWACDIGRLIRDVIARASRWVQTRCRTRLGQKAYLAVGSVDFALKDRHRLSQSSYWSPHVHVLLLIEGGVEEDLQTLVERAFDCAHDVAAGNPMPVTVLELASKKDVEQVREYVCCKLLERSGARTMARLNRGPKWKKLRVGERQELLRILMTIKPRDRLILCGMTMRNKTLEILGERYAPAAHAKRIPKRGV